MPSNHPTPTRGLRAAALAATLALAAAAAPAATLTLDAAGRLLGATGVDVAGASYDVRFTDGSCASLYGGCDAVSDFAFSSNAQARAASLALMAQVFNAFAAIDADPTLTQGCEEAGYVHLGQRQAACYAVTPYGFAVNGDVATHVALNDIRDFMDQAGGPDTATIFGREQSLAGNTSFSRYYTYAVWSPAGSGGPSPAPAPASIVLAGLGLLLLRATTAGSRPAR